MKCGLGFSEWEQFWRVLRGQLCVCDHLKEPDKNSQGTLSFPPSPLPQVIFALNQTLLQQESLRAGSFQIPYTTEDLIKHYNCGDLSSIIFNHDTSQVSLATMALYYAHVPVVLTSISRLSPLRQGLKTPDWLSSVSASCVSSSRSLH